MARGMGTARDATSEVLPPLAMTTIFGNPGSNETSVSRASPFRLPVRLDSRCLFLSNRPTDVGQFARSRRRRPMLRRGYILETPYHISAMTPHFAQLFGKKPPYGSFTAHVVHCWRSPPSIQ